MNDIIQVGRCGRLRCPRKWVLPRSFFANLSDQVLWFVWAGSGEIQTHCRRAQLFPGVCVWMHPGGSYAATHNPDFPLGVTYIHFTVVAGGEKRLPDITRSSDWRFFDEATRKIVELTRVEPFSGSVRKMGGRLLEVVIEQMIWDDKKWNSAPGLGDARLQVIHRLLAEMRQPGGQHTQVGQFARRAGYSPDHFARIFQKVTGSTPQEFLIQHRMVEARRLLADTNLKIEAVAELLGYRNPYFFSRQFRIRTGTSPSAFRKTQAKPGALRL